MIKCTARIKKRWFQKQHKTLSAVQVYQTQNLKLRLLQILLYFNYFKCNRLIPLDFFYWKSLNYALFSFHCDGVSSYDSHVNLSAVPLCTVKLLLCTSLNLGTLKLYLIMALFRWKKRSIPLRRQIYVFIVAELYLKMEAFDLLDDDVGCG